MQSAAVPLVGHSNTIVGTNFGSNQIKTFKVKHEWPTGLNAIWNELIINV